MTLRLAEPWYGSARLVVADAWFGSFKCAYELLNRGVFSVMNVKTCRKRFPLKQLKEAMHTRGDTMHMKVDVLGGHTVYASAHMDV